MIWGLSKLTAQTMTSTSGIWEILDHSAPLPFAHLSLNLGHSTICRYSNLVRRRMACAVGKYIRFLQQKTDRNWREERFPNHLGKVSITSNLHIHNSVIAVKHWISSGRELSLSHPCKSSVWRDECKCLREVELRLGKASNSSQNPPIDKDFKQVRQCKSSGNRVNFWQSTISKLVRECKSRRSGIDFRLGQLKISKWMRECNLHRYGIDIRLGQFVNAICIYLELISD